MRVLHCVPSLDPSYGGPVAVLKGLTRQLDLLGVSSSILCCSTGSPEADASNASAFPGARILWSHPAVSRFYWEPFLARRLRKRLKDFDLLHIHGFFNGITRAACLAARRSGIPYVLEPFGTLSPRCLARNGFMKNILLIGGARGDIEAANAVFFTSEFERDEALKNFHISRSFIAPNGLDWVEFEAPPAVGRFREEWKLKDGCQVLLFIGRLDPIKGLEVFLPAFLDWAGAEPGDWIMVLAGPDKKGYRKKLERLAETKNGTSRVLFTGPLYGAERIRAMMNADLIVLPSFHESFGLSALEGMACAKPVLVSDQVALHPVIRRLDAGEVAAVDARSMRRALERMAERRSQWPAMGQRARRWAAENSRWEWIAGKVAGEYKKILQEDSAR